MNRLSDKTAATLPQTSIRSQYNRQQHQIGILHLGLGAFHRAHQAVYTDQALAVAGGNWRICGVSLCTPVARDQLVPQDCLFTVAEKSSTGTSYRLISSLGDALYAPEDSIKLKRYLESDEIKIVSLTITEKGYLNDPATRRLNAADDGIRQDLSHPGTPKTAVGLLVDALARRRKAGLPPFTLLSCDNLPENGKLLRNVLVDFASLVDDGLAQWIEREVAFPCTMVDRIVPATTDADRHNTGHDLGLFDEAVVTTEPFCQWVLEDCFPTGRPQWEAPGAIFTPHVKSFELMKLRLLNGAHSLIAYLGSLAGIGTVSEAMQWPALKDLAERLMRYELLPTLEVPKGFDASDYISTLLDRFANQGLNHELKKIVMDGSQKLPPRWLEAVREQHIGAEKFDIICLGVAAWMRYACGVGENGERYVVSDPMASEFVPRVVDFLQKPDKVVSSLLSIPQIFGTDLSHNQLFCSKVKAAFRSLCSVGTRETIRLQSQG